MASGFFALFDDVAVLLDDIAAMSKVAAKKTAGILGDDLAVNAEKATGFHASRELPVIWAITKGSMINKIIILPVAFLLSAYLPWLIAPILLIGAAYLCYEGTEKVLEWVFHRNHIKEVAAERISDAKELVKHERSKIKSAIRTDFILSIEIVVIALGTVLEKSLMIQVIVVSLIALLATVGVYGLVALLVRMDDVGQHLIVRSESVTGMVKPLFKHTGRLLVVSLPKIVWSLGIIGTIAMLLVGGGIYLHHVEFIHHALDFIPWLFADLVTGLIVGGIVVAVMHLVMKIKHAATETRIE